MRSFVSALLLVLSACATAFVSPEAAAHTAAGAEALAAGELDDAEARLRLALEFQPLLPEAHANLGLVALARGHLEEAESELRAAVELNEDLASAWADLGVVLERRGRRDEARAAYGRALSIQPGAVEPRRNLVALLLDEGALAEARAHAMRLVQVEPGRAPSHALLAYCELRLSRLDAATERVARARAFAPDDRHLDFVDALILAGRGELAAAATQLIPLLDDPEVGWDARLRLTALYIATEARVDARAHIAWLLDRAPDHPAVALLRAAYAEAFGELPR